MSSYNDVPKELRDFNKIFEKICYRHNVSEVFVDFLEMFMKGFYNPSTDFSKQNEFWQKKYTQPERYLFGELICEYLRVFDKMIVSDNSWYDGFGEFYETLAGKYKTQALGQFFTPPEVVNLMVKLNYCDAENKTGLKINDPACGSGRFLIAFNSMYPGNFCVAEDIDSLCCKMTCLNFILHAVNGEVVHHDSLQPDSYFAGWRINRLLNYTGIPMIEDISKEQSFTWNRAMSMKIEKIQEPKTIEIKPPAFEVTKKPELVKQLALF